MFDSELGWYHPASGQDERHDRAVDYSLIVDVAMDVQLTRLNRDSFMVDERDHGGSIARTNDTSCYIMTGKMSPQNCSRGGPSSVSITFEFGEFLFLMIDSRVPHPDRIRGTPHR